MYEKKEIDPSPKQVKNFPLPWWLKICAFISFGGYILIVLFFFLSSLLPTFGELVLEKEGRFETYSGYDVRCKNVIARGTNIYFYDRTSNTPREIKLTGGTIIDDVSKNMDVYIDGEFLDRQNCSIHSAGSAIHGNHGKGAHVYEYYLKLDCKHHNEHIKANLHEYNCSKGR